MRCVFTGIARDGNGNIVPSSTITPFLYGTSTAVSIYTTLTGTTAVNSVAAGDDGSFSFYVDRFDYDREQCFDIQISKTGWTTWKWTNVDIRDVVLGTYSISADKTVTTNLGYIPNGVIYAPATGKTLTMSGSFDAGMYQIFSCVGTGAVTLSGKMTLSGINEVFSTWFGTKGDGSTDDKVAMQQAITATPAGATLIIPQTASYYKIAATNLSEALTISTRINLVINGELRATSHAQQVNPPYIINITASGTTLSGSGTLRGNGSYIAYSTDNNNNPGLLKITSASNVTIKGITFADPPEIALYLVGTTNALISECRFTGGPAFSFFTNANETRHFYILTYYTTNTTITGNYFYMDTATGGSTRQAICGMVDQNESIINNRFMNIHEHSVYALANSSNLIGNTFQYNRPSAEQFGSAVVFAGNTNNISNNNIYGATLGGISARTSTRTIISNNNLYGVGYVGIGVGNLTGSTTGLDHNIISGNYLKAISYPAWVTATAYVAGTSWVIESGTKYECLISHTSGTFATDLAAGKWVAKTATIYQGILYRAVSPFAFTSYGGKIINNILDGWGDSISIATSSIAVYSYSDTYPMKGFEIKGNTITNSTAHGIHVAYNYKLRISDNYFYNNPASSFRAIYPLGTNSDITINGNVAEDYQVVPTMFSFFYPGVTATNVWMLNNECYGASAADPFAHSLAQNNLGRGNKVSRASQLIGNFTFAATAATKVVNNGNLVQDTLTDSISFITLTPLNAAAALAMGSDESVYVSAITVRNTATTSGSLVVGAEYTITDWNTDDDFTNVGASANADGVVFTATGTTPTKWTNASILTATGYFIVKTADAGAITGNCNFAYEIIQ